MRYLLLLVLGFGVAAAQGAQGTQGYRGLSLSTPYPDQAIHAGEAVSIPLTVHNFGLPPQAITLTVAKAPPGWKADFAGGGNTIGAVFVNPNDSQSISLNVTPPKGTDKGSYSFLLSAQGSAEKAELPLKLTFTPAKPVTLTLTANLPALKGSPSTSFSYDLTLDNQSDKDLTVNLTADAPQGFAVNFKSQFGSQEITSLPVKAGQSTQVTAALNLPQGVKAGSYPFTVQAKAGEASGQIQLTAIVTGQPSLSLSTPTGNLAGRAHAGKDTSVALVVTNTGSAPAQDISFSANSPNDWKVSFDPKTLSNLPPNKKTQVTATVTPSAKSLSGDYMVTFNADSEQANSASADYRVTVLTSTVWGIVGVAIVVAALLVVGFAVARFGRR